MTHVPPDAPPIRRAARFGLDVELRAIRNGGRDWPAHWHADLQVIATVDGLGAAQVAGRRMALARGSLLVLPPGMVHTARAAEPGGDWTFLSLHASPERFALDPRERWDTLLAPLEDGLARDFARLVEALFEKHGDAATAWGDFFAALTRRLQPTAAAPRPPWLEAARAALEGDLDRDFGVEALASHAGVGRRALERAFRDAFHLSPAAWRTIARIEAAKTRLRQGGGVAEAARAAGLADPRRFSRSFRQVTGLSARTYRLGFAGEASARPPRTPASPAPPAP